MVVAILNTNYSVIFKETQFKDLVKCFFNHLIINQLNQITSDLKDSNLKEERLMEIGFLIFYYLHDRSFILIKEKGT
ncbi:MAG: hypothetical protein ACTSUT_01005 [Promethearchaeota archaeon]